MGEYLRQAYLEREIAIELAKEHGLIENKKKKGRKKNESKTKNVRIRHARTPRQGG